MRGLLALLLLPLLRLARLAGLPSLAGEIVAGAPVGCAVRQNIGAHRARHAGARRVMLAQESRQRARRDGLEQPVRTLVTNRACCSENLGRGFTGLKILCRHRTGSAYPKRYRRQTERSARHRWSPETARPASAHAGRSNDCGTIP